MEKRGEKKMCWVRTAEEDFLTDSILRALSANLEDLMEDEDIEDWRRVTFTFENDKKEEITYSEKYRTLKENCNKNNK